MARTSDRPQPESHGPHSVTRRALIQTACVTAAGAALLEGCARGTSSTAGGHRGTNGGAAFLADSKEKKPAEAEQSHTHVHRPSCVAVISNTEAVTCDDEGVVARWDISTVGAAAKVGEFPQRHTKPAAFLVADPQRGRVLSAGYDGKVLIHNLANAPNLGPFLGHNADKRNPEVWSVAVSKDGRFALSGTNDGQILLWEVANPQGNSIAFKFSNAAIAGLAFVPDGRDGAETHFLSTHGSGRIKLWDLRNLLPKEGPIPAGQPVVTTPADTFEHGNKRYVNAVAVTPDGRRFLSAGFDNAVLAWDLAANLPGPQAGVAVAEKPAAADAVPAGAQEAVGQGGNKGGNDPPIRIPGNVKPGPKPKLPDAVFKDHHKDNVWRLALRGDDVFASASNDGTVVVLNHRTRATITSFDTIPKGGEKKLGGGVMGVAFTGDGRIVYTGISDESAPLTSRPVIVATTPK